MDYFNSYVPRFNSLDFDLHIWLRAPKVTGTFEKRIPWVNWMDLLFSDRISALKQNVWMHSYICNRSVCALLQSISKCNLRV